MTPATDAEPIKLGKFEGVAVNAVGVEVRNAAGGLNDAMKVDPAAWHIGEEITLVLRCSVTKVRHDPLKDADGLRRVHILDASEATVIDDELVAEALDAQAIRIEQALGIHQLPIALMEAHDAGEHADGYVDDCPGCEKELAAAHE